MTGATLILAWRHGALYMNLWAVLSLTAAFFLFLDLIIAVWRGTRS